MNGTKKLGNPYSHEKRDAREEGATHRNPAARVCGLVETVVHHAVVGEGLVLGAGTAEVGKGVDGDASAWHKKALHLDIAWLHEAVEVVHDDVDTVLVEVAMIAEREKIEFETFALYHAPVGDVAYADFGKIGLPGDGTQRGELGAEKLHPIVVVGMLIFESLQHFGVIIGSVFGVMTQHLQIIFGSVHRI